MLCVSYPVAAHGTVPTVAVSDRDAKGECGRTWSDFDRWRELGQQLRVDAVRASSAAGSGHPTSSMSAADLAAVLLAGHFRYDFDDPKSPANDRLDLLQGPRLAARLRPLPGRRRDLRGGVHDLPAVRLAPGGPPDARAAVGRRRDRLARAGPPDRRRHGARRQAARPRCRPDLGDLRRQRDGRGLDVGGRRRTPPSTGSTTSTAIVDVNRLGQRGETMHGWDLDVVRRSLPGVRLARDRGRRARRRGDRRGLLARRRRPRGEPTAIVARTIKGKGTRRVEDKHGLARQGDLAEDAEEALAELGGVRNDRRRRAEARAGRAAPVRAGGARSGPRYELGSKVATRKAYGEALAGARRRRRGDVVALDGEVDNSTFAGDLRQGAPGPVLRDVHRRAADGRARRSGCRSSAGSRSRSTFAAFLSRAYDFVRMAAISAGDDQALRLARRRLDRRGRPVADGARGPRLAARASTARPCSIRATATRRRRSSRAMADLRRDLVPAHDARRHAGALRPGRGVPGRRLARRCATATTSHDRGRRDHAARGAEGGRALAGDGIEARVIDLYSVKPVDAETLRAAERDRADRHRRGPLARGRDRRRGARRRSPRRGRAGRAW